MPECGSEWVCAWIHLPFLVSRIQLHADITKFLLNVWILFKIKLASMIPFTMFLEIRNNVKHGLLLNNHNWYISPTNPGSKVPLQWRHMASQRHKSPAIRLFVCLLILTSKGYQRHFVKGINQTHMPFVRGIHPHKGPVIQEVFPWHDVTIRGATVEPTLFLLWPRNHYSYCLSSVFVARSAFLRCLPGYGLYGPSWQLLHTAYVDTLLEDDIQWLHGGLVSISTV